MRTAKDNISERLTEEINIRRAERAQILAECKSEKAKATALIEALKAAQEDAESPEVYKKNAEQIHEQEAYVNYLTTKANTTQAKPIITKEEYNEIEKELEAENKRLVDANAAQILKKFDELTALLDDYSKSANDLQIVLNEAQEAAFSRKLGGHFWHELRERRPDPYGAYNKMLMTYFNHRAGELNA